MSKVRGTEQRAPLPFLHLQVSSWNQDSNEVGRGSNEVGHLSSPLMWQAHASAHLIFRTS